MLRILTRYAGAALLILGLLIPAASAPAATLLPVNGTPQFIHGINCGWFESQYDHDIGINPLHPEWGCWYDPVKVQQYLQDMKNMNANVVRIWLHENKEGLVLDGTGHVTGLDPTFVTNLDDLVARAGALGLTIYMTLNGGDFDWVMDVSKQTSYLENAVKPMATRYQGSSTIFAYDVMNEIEGVVGGPDGNWGVGATWDQARAYITAASAAIRSVDSGRLITCSSGWHGYANLQNGYFSGLGLDFYDCHVYDDAGFVPDASVLGLDKPVILGEHGQSGAGNSDTVQNNSCTGFLQNTSAGGWAGHAIWHYDHAGSTDIHRMLNSDGSWRPVCYTMRDFVYTPPGPPPNPVPSIKLTGTIIGTSGSWGNNPATTKEAAMDGLLSTFYDAVNASGDWVGLDLGTATVITQVKYCPRSTYASRMTGGVFQGSPVADFSSGVVTLFTIATAPSEGILTARATTEPTAFRYVRYLSPASGYCNVAEIEFYKAAAVSNPPPAAPTALSATAASSSQIDLSWTASSGAASYNVKRSTTSSGPYSTVATGVAATSFSDIGLTASTTYYYVVSAVNSGGESVNSSQATATTQADTTAPAAPTGLAATAGDGTVSLNWADNSEPDLAGYKVNRATASGGPFTTIAVGVTVSAYTDNTVVNGTTYYYVVSAVDTSTNESANGNEASATPSVAPPSFVAAGAIASGTGSFTTPLPAGIASGDILLLFMETANETVSVSNPNGGTWAQVTGSPQGTGTAAGSSATRLTVFWSRYNGTQGNPTVSDSGNHQIARIIAVRGAVTSGNPWDVTAGAVESTSDTSASIPGATTTVANTLVVVAVAGNVPDANSTSNVSGWSNPNLTGLTERTDDTRNSGNGGALGIATGVKMTAGGYGATSVTHGSSAVKGMISIALKK